MAPVTWEPMPGGSDDRTDHEENGTWRIPPLGLAAARRVDRTTWRVWLAWTALFWGGTAVLAVLFYVGTLDFVTSTRASLYGTSVWLNGWILPLLRPGASRRERSVLWHECLCLWLVSYTMTNLLWEIPWLLSSPYAFEDLNSLADVAARTDWIREAPLRMGWWVIASFSSVDLRTVNHNSTFFALEWFAFMNVAGAVAFHLLNKRRSALRYLVPVLGSGEPIAATFIFSFSEVFAGYPNMAGGTADTFLALVWTQYQYFVFPMVFAWVGCKLLLQDLHVAWFRRGGGHGDAVGSRRP